MWYLSHTPALFIDLYGEKSILLVDTYDCRKGIQKATHIASEIFKQQGVKIRGIRIDSGDLREMSLFARNYFNDNGVDFLNIFVSGNLDEFTIQDLVEAGAPIDGFGVGTRFTVSHNAPNVDIAYKLTRYSDKGLNKESPGKKTLPGRKVIIRSMADGIFTKDIVEPLSEHKTGDSILKPFTGTEKLETIQKRMYAQINSLPDNVKRITEPDQFPVEFKF